MTALPIAPEPATEPSANPRPPSGSSRRRRRMLANAAGIVAALLTAAIPIVAGGAPVRPQLALAGVAIVALFAALAGWEPGFAIGAIALGTEYALRLTGSNGLSSIDGIAVIESVALFATVELGLRALDARSLARPEARVRRTAAVRLAAMLAGAAAAAFVVLALGTHRLPAPTAGLALGLAAAAALLSAAEVLRRRVTGPRSSM